MEAQKIPTDAPTEREQIPKLHEGYFEELMKVKKLQRGRHIQEFIIAGHKKYKHLVKNPKFET
jgi:hypothetical protein